MNSTQQKFETWALVELFGHQRIVGRLTEQPVGGASFIRVDVPAADGSVAYTRLFGAAAIYAINPVTQDVALALAQRVDAVPIQAYEVPRPRLEAGVDSGASDPADEECDLDDYGNPIG